MSMYYIQPASTSTSADLRYYYKGSGLCGC